MKYLAHLALPDWRTEIRWMRLVHDSLLAIGGVGIVTGVIVAGQLYPRVQAISLVYLLVVLALASTRGFYASILASLLTLFSFDFFFFPPWYTLTIFHSDDLLTLSVFLVAAILTSQLASALRRRIEQGRDREQELRQLYEQAQELAALQERQYLARELHDSVSQVLYSMGLSAHTILEALESNDQEQVRTSTEYVITLAEAGLVEMHALIFELRPESMEAEGLVAALTRQVAVLRTRYKLVVEPELSAEPELSLPKKHALYRIAQEALHNIIKHARATAVTLHLTVQDQAILLEVRDNGRGFEPDGSFPGHLGMSSMRERAAKIGATLVIASTPGAGTCLSVRVPLDAPDRE